MSDFDSKTDEELARESQAGSLAAFEQLLYRYEKRVFAFTSQWCKPGMDAAELTQDTFIKAFRALDQYRGRHPFSNWLFTIARRKCIDAFRALPPRPEEQLPELAIPDNPAMDLVHKEDRTGLWQTARSLPQAQFEVLWLHYAEDMDVREVARIVHKTRTHVKVLLFRARRALGKYLAQERTSQAPSVSAAEPRTTARTLLLRSQSDL